MRILTLTAIMTCAVACAEGQDADRLTRNAVLRYWSAFALMSDAEPVGRPSNANASFAELLQATESGASPWDERIAPLLDRNAAALATLARGTRLPDCDWGLDYELGASAPIPHHAKARALARLNTLASIRALAGGKGDEAVKGWLVGLRFALDIGCGETLHGTMTAASALRSTLGSVERAAAQGRLTAAQRARVAEGIRALSDTVFDWGRAFLNDIRALETSVTRARSDAAYRKEFALGQLPSTADSKWYAREVEQLADALGRSPESADPVITAFEADTSVPEFYRRWSPSPKPVNAMRRDIRALRQRVLAALK